MSRQPFYIPASQLIFKNIKYLGFWMSRWNQTHSREEKDEMLNDVIALMKFKKEKSGNFAFEEVLWGNQNESNESLKNKFLNALDKSGTGFHGKKQILKMQF
jgi:trans-2-enoyl-CoA reductase